MQFTIPDIQYNTITEMFIYYIQNNIINIFILSILQYYYQ